MAAMESALAEMGNVDDPGKAVGAMMKVFIKS